MRALLLTLALLASQAWAAPFATADIEQSRITHCDYEDTTTGETARIPVVVDPVRGNPANGYRVCKFDISHWIPGTVHAARMRSVDTLTGDMSTWTAATLDRPAASSVSLALLHGITASPPPENDMSTGSRDFTANTQYLDSGTWGFSSDAVTIAGWVYIDTIPAGRDARFVSKADGTGAANHDWMLGYSESSGTATLRARTHRSSLTLLASTGLSTGQWVHVAVTADVADASIRILYISGSADNFDGNAVTTITSNSNAVYVGNQPTSATAAPDGRLSDFAVWSVALTGTQIANLASLANRPSDYTTGLQVYYSGGDLTDSSGNGRTATNNSTTLSSADPGFGASTVGKMSLLGVGY